MAIDQFWHLDAYFYLSMTYAEVIHASGRAVSGPASAFSRPIW